MNLYDEVIIEIKKENLFKELYRFQGTNSFEYFDIKTAKFIDTSKDNYIYISNSLDHHKYFALKRIRQLLNKVILQEKGLRISSKDLRDNNNYSTIKKLIFNSDKLQNMYSIRLICDNNIIKLMKENSFSQNEKNIGKTLERVDRRVYGGGFGVADEWKNLIMCLTYFNGYQRIDRNSIISLLSNMRKTGKVNSKENIEFILNSYDYYSFELSPKLESNFTKYEIMNSIEQILKNGTYSQESELANNPTKTIKKVVEDYERGKEKILTLLDKYYTSKTN